MDKIIPLLIVSVLIGIPTWLMVRTMNKADKNTIVYSPEEVTKKLRKGFYLSFCLGHFLSVLSLPSLLSSLSFWLL